MSATSANCAVVVDAGDRLAGHALHALAIYDQRAFAPFDADEKPAEKQPATAGRSEDSQSR